MSSFPALAAFDFAEGGGPEKILGFITLSEAFVF